MAAVPRQTPVMPSSSIILILFFIKQTLAIVCPLPGGSGSHRNKTCPDFKADPSFVFCCTSKLPLSNVVYKERHGVFCCSETDYQREQEEMADAEFRNFVKDYLALIILCSLIAICLLVVVTSLLCKRFRRCPLYTHRPAGLSHSTQANSMYRPVDTIPPKMYEAPPPYECFVPPPEQGGNDWNCVLENEVNGGRRLPPTMTS